MKEIYDQTLRKDEYVKALGYETRIAWECEWERAVEKEVSIKAFLAVFFQAHYPSKQAYGLDGAIEHNKDGRFFGFVECDIHVTEELRDKFSEI